MRKLKLQVQISIDGFIAGLNGEMDWLVWNWDDKLKEYVIELTESIDCIVMGRILAEGFIPHWEIVASNPEHPEFLFGKKMQDTPKVVFSRTLNESLWNNSKISNDLLKDIIDLKNKQGKDIIVYGGSAFVSSLINEGLIDEFHLFMNPSAIGTGMPIFRQLERKQDFKLIKAHSFECGIVVLNYVPK